MTKTILKVAVRVIILVAIIASRNIISVSAASIWMSVDPSEQTVESGYAAWWTMYMGKEAGCPEHDLKYRVYFGDGYRQTGTGIWACYPNYILRGYSPGDYVQDWYGGQGTGPFYYQFSTDVHQN